MTIVDTFETIDKALDKALTELDKALSQNSVSPSVETKDGMIESWVHDFQMPNNDGVFRLKFVIERTTEQGSERLPIISNRG